MINHWCVHQKKLKVSTAKASSRRWPTHEMQKPQTGSKAQRRAAAAGRKSRKSRSRQTGKKLASSCRVKERQLWREEQVSQSTPALLLQRSPCSAWKKRTDQQSQPQARPLLADWPNSNSSLEKFLLESNEVQVWLVVLLILNQSISVVFFIPDPLLRPFLLRDRTQPSVTQSDICLSACLHVNRATGQLIGFLKKFHKLLDLAFLLLPTVMGF